MDIRSVLKEAFPVLDGKRKWTQDVYEHARWQWKGQPPPTPEPVKRQVLRRAARSSRCRVFVETGTFRGEMLVALKDRFQRLYSIEIDDALFQRATTRLAPYKNITLLKGDSGTVLPDLLRRVSEPCFFWLDGHYSGGITGRGAIDSPVSLEMESILSRNYADDVIFIDDMRDFTGANGYPTIDGLKRIVSSRWTDAKILVAMNIMQITRAR